MSARPLVDRLESRRLLAASLASDGTLTVTGTPRHDAIGFTFDESGATLTVDVLTYGDSPASVKNTFPASEVLRILVDAGDGDDNVSLYAQTINGPHDFLTQPATLLGGAGSDGLSGGSGDDVIRCGSGGKDVARGNGGSDLIYGEGGSFDILWGEGIQNGGGSGLNDTIYGGAGVDSIYGGPGNDELHGGSGGDELGGGVGNDRLYGDDGNDLLDGQSSGDRLFGGPGDDRLTGGSGRDLFSGGDGTDTATDRTAGDEVSLVEQIGL
jgi:Ca2+-binding RTX toxin-like protein